MIDGSDQHLVDNFTRLREQCIDLRTISNEFKVLFSNEEKPTLDGVAPAVFQVIHDCMIEIWWLRVGRLMDPPITLGHENLSLENILKRCSAVQDEDIFIVFENIKRVWSKMKHARDKQIAHNDLEASRKGSWSSTISEAEGEGFEDDLQRICDLIGNKLGVGPLEFRSSSCPGDASDLLDFLEFGVRARDAWELTHGVGLPIRGMYRDPSK